MTIVTIETLPLPYRPLNSPIPSPSVQFNRLRGCRVGNLRHNRHTVTNPTATRAGAVTIEKPNRHDRHANRHKPKGITV